MKTQNLHTFGRKILPPGHQLLVNMQAVHVVIRMDSNGPADNALWLCCKNLVLPGGCEVGIYPNLMSGGGRQSCQARVLKSIA